MSQERQPRSSALSLRSLLWAAALCGSLSPGVSAADPCVVEGVRVPACVTVTSPRIDLKPRFGSAIVNVFCPRSASYYWGSYSADHDGWVRVHDLSRFITNPAEGKFEATNFNLEFRHSFTVTIGCSQFPPWGTACQGSNAFCPRDPGCATTSGPASRCVGQGENQQCWLEWEENCGTAPNNTPYFCTTALFAPCCYPCAGR
jgi:hypothetical protein